MTKDKTVTMSRELIEVVEAYMSSQADAFPMISLPRGLRSDGLDQVSSELRIALAAPVVERQPIAEVQHGPFDDVCAPQWVRVVTLGDFDIEHIPDGTKLWTSPPAPVLPERMVVPKPKSNLSDMDMFDYEVGFNACLDKVKEMN